MSSPPVPDPYQALGIPKDATSTTIKSTYRKLALKFHPDKVTDESQKESAAENFHRIQQAYEILGDDEKRAKYDATIKLAELRREVLQRQQHQPPPQSQPPPQAYRYPPPPQQSPYTASRPPPSPAAARPDVRVPDIKIPTGSPRASATYNIRPEPRYETMRPSVYVDDDLYDDPSSRPSSRKQSYAEKDPRRHLSRSESDRKIYVEKERSSRHDRRKNNDKDRRRDRESKRTYVVDDGSDSDTIEIPMPRSRGLDRDFREPDTRDYRHGRGRYSSESEDFLDDATRRLTSAHDYISSVNVSRDGDDRRKPSLRNPTVESLRDRESTRRSSARSPTKESSYPRDYERQRQNSEPQVLFRSSDPFASRPGLEKTHSSPAAAERRSRTLNTPKSTHYDIPTMKRAETMPTPSSSSSRRPDPPSRGESKLRQSAEMHHGLPTPGTSPPHDSFTNSRPTTRSKSYVIEKDRTRELSPRTVDRRLTRSPSPLAEKQETNSSRPRMTRSSTSRRSKPSSSAVPPPPPPLNTSGSYGTPGLDTPISAVPRPPLSREHSSPAVFGIDDDNIPLPRTRGSRRTSVENVTGKDDDGPYTIQDFSSSSKMKSGGGGGSSREDRPSRRASVRPPAPMKRSHTLGMHFFSAALRG